MSKIILNEKVTPSDKVLITDTSVSNEKRIINFNEIIDFTFEHNMKTRNFVTYGDMRFRIIGEKNSITYEYNSGPLNAKRAKNIFERIEYVYSMLKENLFKGFIKNAIKNINNFGFYNVSNLSFKKDGIYFRPRVFFFLKKIHISYINAEIIGDYREWGGGMKFSGKNHLFLIKDLSNNTIHKYSHNFRFQPNINEINKAQQLLEYINEKKVF